VIEKARRSVKSPERRFHLAKSGGISYDSFMNTTTLSTNYIHRSLGWSALLSLLISCFELLPNAQAVVPAPDGGYLGGNTAEGNKALLSLTTGTYNTAVGVFSLLSDSTGSLNTGVGAGTLLANTGDSNTAVGAGALLSNTNGFGNTADGTLTLFSNSTGGGNTGTGYQALFSNTDGAFNTAIGFEALFNNTTGINNTALGNSAGLNVRTAFNVICIGANVAGEDLDNGCYIGSIFGQTSSGGSAVFINSSGKLGTSTSSQRFKDDIKAVERASEILFALKPVTFRYKKEIDPAGTSQFGLVAEEVEKVNRDLVVRDKDGKPYTVRYDQVNAMLLNEFLKEHRTVQEQKVTIAELKHNFAEQQKQIEALAAGLQKVSAQLKASKPAPQMVLSNQ